MQEIEKEAEEVLEKLSKSLEKEKAALKEKGKGAGEKEEELKEVYYITSTSNVFREDEGVEDKPEFREAAKKNAPKFNEGYFVAEVGGWVK